MTLPFPNAVETTQKSGLTYWPKFNTAKPALITSLRV